jgi:hypothetical protein
MGEPSPFRQLSSQMSAASARERVEFDLAARVDSTRLCGDPAVLLETIQRGIQRPLRNLKRLAGDLFNALGDRPSMFGLDLDGSENEEVERALD